MSLPPNSDETSAGPAVPAPWSAEESRGSSPATGGATPPAAVLAVAGSAVQESAVQESAVQESAVQESAVQESAVSGSAVVDVMAKPPALPGIAAADLDWGPILRENQSWLRRVLYSRLGEMEAVDECVQEIGLAAVRQSAPIRDLSKIGSWLYQLAIRQALLYRRKMGRKRNLLQRYADRFGPTESDQGSWDPLAWLLDRERSEMVRVALGELKEDDRQILLLKYAENWSYGQIAEYLGVSHSAVEARLHRSRQRLRKIIERRDDWEDSDAG